MTSSINFNKRFATLPLSFSLSLNHNQNINNETMNLTLPQFNLNVSRIYPFSKNGKKNNALQKMYMTYKLDAVNLISTTDEFLFTNKMWEGGKMGAKHSVPISTDMKIFKYINFAPSFNFSQVLVMQTYEKTWDPTANNGNGTEIIKEIKGFSSFTNIDFSASLSTAVFGTYLFGDKHKINGIRHTIRPNLSYAYRPKNEEYFKSYYKGTTPDDEVEYSIFDGWRRYGRPNMIEGKTLRLNVTQDFEAKIKLKDGKYKKIRLLDISSNYDFTKDTMQLSDFNLHSSIKLSKNLNIDIRSAFDLYAVNDDGKNIDKFAVNNGQGLGHFRGFSVTTGYNFSNKTFQKTNNKSQKQKQQKELDAYHNPIIWDLNLGYRFTYANKAYAPIGGYFKEIPSHTVTFRGKIKFSPGWSMRYTSGYDFVNKGFVPTQLNFVRDLKSWRMTFMWEPMSKPNRWFFNIGIKSSLLQGIKYDKHYKNYKQFF
jgi:hypothetical protein